MTLLDYVERGMYDVGFWVGMNNTGQGGLILGTWPGKSFASLTIEAYVL